MTHYRQTAVTVLAGCLLAAPSAQAGLEEYVKRGEPAFAWKQVANHDTDAGKVVTLELTSQVWQGMTWTHNLTVYEPAKVEFEGPMLLFITGGSTGGRPSPADDAQGFALARLCGARVAVLRQVPNQPLLDGKKEDDLISETFLRYLATKDENWPLLFPMVKSAVKAMDALQEWGEKQGRSPKQFVVTGASKRGWTTWLTGAVDPRVIAIAPMVIPTLNFHKQNPHQLEVWGKYSEQIDDYVRKGLMEKLETDDGQKLDRMVDPYFYRDHVTMPKLLINGTNDRYWTLDSLNLFWDDLKGPKSVVYLPNAGHGLEQHRDYALRGVGALFRHAVSGRKLPEVSWQTLPDDGGGLRLQVSAKPTPKSAQFWVARADTKDFRPAHWEAESSGAVVNVTDGPFVISSRIAPGGPKFAACFWDLTFEVDDMEYHLSTEIYQSGPKDAK